MRIYTLGPDHAVVRDALAILRNKETAPREFRVASRRLNLALAAAATAGQPTLPKNINTPLEPAKVETFSRGSILVPILRAGLDMVDAFREMLPDAAVCHLGLERSEEPPFDNRIYYDRLPDRFDEQIVYVLDPMLATGQSAAKSLSFIRDKGADFVRLVCWIAAPEGIDLIGRQHASVDLFVGEVDRQLNEHGYICPGLGDAGDRIMGTKPREKLETV